MSSQILAGLWEIAPSNLWTLSSTPTPVYVSEDGLGTAIAAHSGGPAEPPPFAQRSFASPLDLRPIEELRFWLRSSRPGDGTSGKPFYFAFEAMSNSPGLSWRRLLPVKQRQTWELHRLWLGDMPDALRQTVRSLRLRSLDATVAFDAVIGDLMATTLEPLQDVDAALLKRLDNRFQVPVTGTFKTVPAIVELPENPGDRIPPYILITPWSVQPTGERGGSGEMIDNYTPTTNGTSEGAFVRPPLWQVQLEYSIDVFAEERSQKTRLLEAILNSYSRQPFLVVNGEPLTITPFMPSPEETTKFADPGRTPLFYRLTTQIETGDRQFQRQAFPFLLLSPGEGRAAAEFVRV